MSHRISEMGGHAFAAAAPWHGLGMASPSTSPLSVEDMFDWLENNPDFVPSPRSFRQRLSGLPTSLFAWATEWIHEWHERYHGNESW